jgi:hypothetical protein
MAEERPDLPNRSLFPPHAEIAWRAGRRRRLASLAVSASAGAVAIVVAVVLLPLTGHGTSRNTPKSSLPPAAPVTLRTAVQFRQIAVNEGPAPCPPNSPDYVFGDQIPACFKLARPGMTITKVESAQIFPGQGYYSIVIRLIPSQVGQLAALTTFVTRQHAPRNQLAVIVDGKVVADPTVQTPLRHGALEIIFPTRAQTERIFRELVGR